jgi:eukaryotic-like serine/threonine-protein kinase
MTGAPARAPGRLGRFELRRVLGRGAQATVWLAFDARLEREVALKLLNRDAGSAAVSEWLHEARAVSRLKHPHIVPVFEADEHDGQCCLVFEFVDGPTLAELLRRRGALPPHEAVGLMLGVLDALRAAHESGIVHRDLKPSNVLVDADGRARVMDFGIAARVSDADRDADIHARLIVGTPGYMSPEAARGEPPAPAMDLFAIGAMLAEMLSGRPLLSERDPHRAIHRVIHEDMALPQGMPSTVDDALRAIVQRAIAREPSQRPASAAQMRESLQRWLQPAGEDGALAATSGTIEFLLRRMRHKTDFPALSDSMSRIQRVANGEHENLNSLSSEILKDVALTNKLLRLVNTAHYSQAGGGTISTVSRAVALVGFAGIRNMALSLVLLEHMHDRAHAQQLKEDFLRSLMAGSLAGELCTNVRDREEAFIGAMFQNLGRLLTEFYFPEEAQQIRRLTSATPAPSGPLPPSDEAASTRVLGVSFEALGIAVAKSWGLPDTLQQAMRRPAGDPPARAAARGPEQMRWLGAAANDVVDALLQNEPKEAARRVAALSARYGRALGADDRQMQAAVERSRQHLAQTAQAMGMSIQPTSRAGRLIATMAPTQPAFADTLSPHQLQATLPAPLDAQAHADTVVLAPAPERVAEMLAAGVQDITDQMAGESFRLNEVLRMILETMYRALGFQRIVFCLRDPKTNTLTGRFGLGHAAERVSGAFKVPLRLPAGAPPDLFAAVCLKGADTLIADATSAAIAPRLPAWFHREVGAPAFLLLPLTMRSAPFALIYADKAQPGALALGEKELALLRTLRNQAVMAFRQAT